MSMRASLPICSRICRRVAHKSTPEFRYRCTALPSVANTARATGKREGPPCNWERDGPPFFPTHNRRLCRPPQCATYSSTVTIGGRCVSLDCARPYLSHGAVRPTWEPDWFVRPQNTCHLRQFPKFFRCINIPQLVDPQGSLIPSSFESIRPATPLPKSQKDRSACIFSVTVFGFQKPCGWMWRRYRYPFLASKRSFTRSKFPACVRDQPHTRGKPECLLP